jgi:hypothetical protein
MYQRPRPKHEATILQMGSGRQAEFHHEQKRLFVGGIAHGDVKANGLPVIAMQALAQPIDYLRAQAHPDEPLEMRTDSYQAQRVTFGGKVFRTWMLQGADPQAHATLAVLALIDADPVRVKQVVETD